MLHVYARSSMTEPSESLADFLNAVFKFAAFRTAFAGAFCQFLFEIGHALLQGSDLLGCAKDLL